MASIYKPKSHKGKRNKPWMISYTDDNGIRKVITGSPDKNVTKELARAKEAEVLRRKHGLSSKTEDRLREFSRTLISVHKKAYLNSCVYRGLTKGTIGMKEVHLNKIIDYADAKTLPDLEPLAVENYLSSLRERQICPNN